MPADCVRVIVVGAGGYTGGELVRLLTRHPRAEVVAYVSSSEPGRPVAERLAFLRDDPASPHFVSLDEARRVEADAVFFATPHGVAMREAEAFLERGMVVLDLGADFRLRDKEVFRRWYGAHESEHLLRQAVYGLPEVARESIATANLIACPGCYATAVGLALLPFVVAGVIDGTVIVDAKSGVSGAGRRSDRSDLLLSEMSGNFKAYATEGHRHHPEILQTLERKGKTPEIHFVPHLLPVVRGIYVSAYLPVPSPEDTIRHLGDYWRSEPFVEVLPAGRPVELNDAVHGNRLVLSAHPLSDNQLLVCATLDNLVKGAAGQAIQNLNIRFGLGETTGLDGARIFSGKR